MALRWVKRTFPGGSQFLDHQDQLFTDADSSQRTTEVNDGPWDGNGRVKLDNNRLWRPDSLASQ